MKTITSIICITALLAFAIYQEVNGILLTGGLVLIAGLGGYDKIKGIFNKRH